MSNDCINWDSRRKGQSSLFPCLMPTCGTGLFVLIHPLALSVCPNFLPPEECALMTLSKQAVDAYAKGNLGKPEMLRAKRSPWNLELYKIFMDPWDKEKPADFAQLYTLGRETYRAILFLALPWELNHSST